MQKIQHTRTATYDYISWVETKYACIDF